MNPKLLLVSLAALLASSTQAQTYDLRNAFDSLGGTYPAQVPGALWTFHYGSQEGGLLPVLGADVYGYACGTCTQIGQKVNTGDSYWTTNAAYTPTFNGVFLHPGPSAEASTAIVFNAPANSWLSGVTVKAEMILNGFNSNGLDIAVRHIRDGVSTSLGSYVVSGPNLSEVSFSFGSEPLLFALGDSIEIDVGPNGSYLYDHLNINVMTTAVAPPVPEPGTYALFLAGLGLLGSMAQRCSTGRRHS